MTTTKRSRLSLKAFSKAHRHATHIVVRPAVVVFVPRIRPARAAGVTFHKGL